MPIPDELYAVCGEALLWTQMHEQEILNSILFHALARQTIASRAEAEDLLCRRDKQPLKKNLDEIFQRVGTEPDLKPISYEALDKRNFFVHRFFWDRMEVSFTKEGREKLIIEASKLAELFERACLIAKGITELYKAQLGMPVEGIIKS